MALADALVTVLELGGVSVRTQSPGDRGNPHAAESFVIEDRSRCTVTLTRAQFRVLVLCCTPLVRGDLGLCMTTEQMEAIAELVREDDAR